MTRRFETKVEVVGNIEKIYDGSVVYSVTGDGYISGSDLTITGLVNGRDIAADGAVQDTHTGDTTIHFTQAEISITESQISDLGTYSTQVEYNYLSGEHSGLNALFTGHTGDPSIHFTVASISLPVSQIDNESSSSGLVIIADGAGGNFWGSAGAGDVTSAQYNYLSGQFTGHTGVTGIHFEHSDISLPIDQINSEATTSGNVIIANGEGSVFWGEAAGGGGGATTLTGLDDTDITDQYYGAFIGYNTSSGQWVDMLLTGSGGIDVTEVPEIKTLFIVGNNPPSAATWTGHTGDPTIHFTQSEISITESQVSDLGVYGTQAGVTSLSGLFTGHTGAADAHTGYILADGSRSMYGRLGSSEAATASTDYIRKVESEAADTVILDYVNLFINTFFAGHTGDLANPHEVTAAQVGAPTTDNYDYLSGLYAAHVASHISELGDLSDVSVVGAVDGNLLVSSKGNWVNSGTLIEELGDISDVTISTPVDGDVISWNGADWSNAPVSGFLQEANNLSDLDDLEEARFNTKTRYYIDDFIMPDLMNSSDKHGVGNTYVFSTNSENFMTGTLGNLGVITASCGNESTAGASAALRYTSNASLDLYVRDIFYFRTAISHTSSMHSRFGLTQAVFNSEDDVANGAYFEFNSTGSANWFACTAAGGTRTKTDMGIAATADEWKWWGIQPVASGIFFYDMDNTVDQTDALAFISTNIPAKADSEMRLFINNICNGATYRHMWIDKFAYPMHAAHLPTGLAAQL